MSSQNLRNPLNVNGELVFVRKQDGPNKQDAWCTSCQRSRSMVVKIHHANIFFCKRCVKEMLKALKIVKLKLNV